MPPVPAVLCPVGELDAVVSQHRVDLVREGRDDRVEEVDGGHPLRVLVELSVDGLRGAVNRDEQVELPSSVQTSAESMWA